ncbi:MAG: hypothetical protein KQI62_04830 [Deltaproteobacteria bacterium]|nr:hypothetical protein [Deltaproteobacteria bacterium]
MNAVQIKLGGLSHPLVWAAGLSWGLLAATRWAVVMAAQEGGQNAVIWQWPPWWIPVTLGLAMWLAQILTSCWQYSWLTRQGMEGPRARRLAGRAWLPSLALFLVPLAELLPPMYGGSPAPLALSREAWPLAALAAAGAVFIQTRLAAPELLRKRDEPHSRWLSLIVFILALALFAGVGARLTLVSSQVGKFMGGDEPQYLFNAHTLAVDHDLDLAENIFLRENSYYLDPGKVIGGHGGWTDDGRWISKHRPGLPTLMAPFYAWGLYLGQGPRKTATICLWLLAAWMVTEVFWLGRLFTGRDGPALLGAAGAALALPGLIYSNLAFPEIAAAAFSVSAFRLMRSAGRGQWGLLFLAGLLTGYLPWFHERFAVLCLVLGAYFLARMHWRSFKGLIAFALPCLASAGLLASYFMWLYGQPFPGQEIHAQGHYLNPRGFWEGLSGIWVDAGEGMLTYGAIWLAAVAGLVWLVRRRFSDGFWCLAMAGAVYVVAGLFADWFGGINPPSRYLVAAVPFLAVGLAAGAHWGPPRYLLYVAVLGVLSLAASLWVMHYPSAVYGHKVVLGSGLQFPLIDNLLPAFIFNYKVPQENAQLALIWMLLALAAVVAMNLGNQRFGPGRALAGLVLAMLLVAGSGVAADHIGQGVLNYRNPAQRVVLWNRLSDMPSGGAIWRLGAPDVEPKALMELPLPPARYQHGPVKTAPEDPQALDIPAGIKPGLYVWGQYLALPPGRYQATAIIHSPYAGPEQVAWVDLSENKGQSTLMTRRLSGQELKQAVSLEFSLKRWATNLEFRVGTTGLASLRVLSMNITRLEP